LSKKDCWSSSLWSWAWIYEINNKYWEGSNHESCWQRPHEFLKDILQLNNETKEKIWEIHYKNRTIQADFTYDDSCDHDDSEKPDEDVLSAKEKIERQNGILKKWGWRDETKKKGL
jgi:hypothetical protein